MPQPLRYEDLNVNVNLCLLEALMPEPSVQQQHNPSKPTYAYIPKAATKCETRQDILPRGAMTGTVGLVI